MYCSKRVKITKRVTRRLRLWFYSYLVIFWFRLLKKTVYLTDKPTIWGLLDRYCASSSSSSQCGHRILWPWSLTATPSHTGTSTYSQHYWHTQTVVLIVSSMLQPIVIFARVICISSGLSYVGMLNFLPWFVRMV